MMTSLSKAVWDFGIKENSLDKQMQNVPHSILRQFITTWSYPLLDIRISYWLIWKDMHICYNFVDLVKFCYAGKGLGPSKFLLLSKLPLKMSFASKNVKTSSKIVISLV